MSVLRLDRLLRAARLPALLLATSALGGCYAAYPVGPYGTYVPAGPTTVYAGGYDDYYPAYVGTGAVYGGWGVPVGIGWGYGWRGGVYVGIPPVVVGTPAPYGYPYSPYRWLPGYYTPYGAWVPPHWGY